MFIIRFSTLRIISMLLFIVFHTACQAQSPASELHGKLKYDHFEKPDYCGTSCHTDIYQQWKQAMMSQAYTHHWDEIEYFKLAVPHAEKDPVVADIKAGCNGCHTPIAFMAGDTPPQPPIKMTRANESVSCDVCHTMKGHQGTTAFNFNFIPSPGKIKYASRQTITSPAHETAVEPFYRTTELCGSCHNEKDPYGIWVKSTQLEWLEGPYSKEGVKCQDCHMPSAPGKLASMGREYADVRQHLFHGAHDPGKIRGTIELRVHPDIREAEPGEDVKITIVLFNQKTGHKFPTGSVEDRIVWMHVEAIDSKGTVYHLPVDKKNFPGEEYTIGSDVLAYQDMGIALGIENFPGVQRDGIPLGDRIFRMAYLDPQGRMTIQQWNTKSLGPDYRLAPRETKVETCTFHLPDNIAPGPVRVSAVLNYQKLVKPVADYLGVPSEESEIIRVNEHSTVFTILD